MQISQIKASELSEVVEIAFAITEQLTGTSAEFNWNGPKLIAEFEMALGWVLKIHSKSAAFMFCRDLADAFEITVLATDPKFQRNGYQTKLVEYLKELASLRQKSIWLEVHEKNQFAIQFYIKNGFHKTGVRPAYYPDGAAAFLMSWPGEPT